MRLSDPGRSSVRRSAACRCTLLSGLTPGGDGMPHSSTISPRSYLITVAAVALAMAARVALDPLLGGRFPFLAFFVAIIFAAWYGGFGPALLAVCLSWLAIDRFLMEPRGPVPVFGGRWQLGVAFFVVGLAVALLGEALRAARRARSGQRLGSPARARRAARRPGAPPHHPGEHRRRRDHHRPRGPRHLPERGRRAAHRMGGGGSDRPPPGRGLPPGRGRDR